jgi:hypothetical protein
VSEARLYKDFATPSIKVARGVAEKARCAPSRDPAPAIP